MPNKDNIRSPITLFGNGRSGTSVLYRAFSRHPDVETAGESANLIFTTWRALEQISGITPYGKIEKRDYGVDAAGLVRHAFLAVFPSEKKQWMHKPIGLPRIHRDFPDVEPDSDVFVEWYWTVFRRCFPQSRNLAILRNPLDVVISGKRYLGVEDALMWRSLKFLYRSLAQGRNHIRIVVRYAEMIADPVATLKRICEAVELDYDPRMPRAFDQLHVPVRGTMFGSEEDLAEKRRAGFSHADERAALVLDDDALRTIERYRETLALFGLPDDEAAP
ncbi:MAG TPA: sulfotransferase [Rhizomicrobium sp.]|nr:sulfotransferase [Rhizomicrobium sp.]